MSTTTRHFSIHGMHCEGCETAIENAVSALPGIEKINADYEGDRATVIFDHNLVSSKKIMACINDLGYEAVFLTTTLTGEVSGSAEKHAQHPALKSLRQALKVILILAAVLGIVWLDTWFMDYTEMPKLSRDIGYGLLVLIGFLTSFHCVGMCGPFIIGYSARVATADGQRPHHFAHLFYALGKTLSYTALGAVFGAFGAIIAFTPFSQGLVGIAAGVFLILYGLHMLELFPLLSHFQIHLPRFVRRGISDEYRKHSNPFVIGLLNGLMIICGPLQAMYVMAAGTGSWTEGASILFFFGLGTLPLLMGFGFLTSMLSGNLTPRLLKASGYIVIILGAIMLNRGFTVTGLGYDANTLVARLAQKWSPATLDAPVNDKEQVITMDVMSKAYVPNKFTLRQGVPVTWRINGKELNECNKEIIVPQLGLTIPLKPGEQVITFTPSETGVIPWSCWMGMIPGTFTVVENKVKQTDDPATAIEQSKAENADFFEKALRWFDQVNKE